MSKPVMTPLPARFIEVVGTAAFLRVMWKTEGLCTNGTTSHFASKEIARSNNPRDNEIGGSMDDYLRTAWPSKCDRCQIEIDHTTAPLFFLARASVYNTASEHPEPGDLFYANWIDCKEDGYCIYGWTNCDGKHLHAILPTGQHWDIDSRCSNCGSPDDKTHRCWVRHGTPPNIHVDKNGHTCSAGGGSIVVPGWHGFLHSGKFVSC